MMVFCLAVLSSVVLGAPNPVLEHTADVGIFRHAGQYYLMGVGTAGGVYRSEDLVHWEGPEHSFSMSNTWAAGPSGTNDNIHACDFVLWNGGFHLYWSVNHGELRQIGHALAAAPRGPYQEPVPDIPFDGRIDPQCFLDEDGSLYFYTVKFTAGNVIWGQPMESPWTLRRRPKPLLSALASTWETQDRPAQMVNEGPFVVQYRGGYYMIYNANHTSPRYGNYALGVAEAESPLGFSNRGKYPFPVLRSSRDARYAGLTPDTSLPEVKNCGQPNLVRGPNGIEWWLVYFADREHRSQYIDRVHFFGRELFVEGPTTSDTPGYHPGPALPSFWDYFEENESVTEQWDLRGAWVKEAGSMRSSAGAGLVWALARVMPAGHYVVEATLGLMENTSGRFGVIAWDNGQDSRLLVGLDRRKNTAFAALYRGNDAEEETKTLPAGFQWEGPHVLRIENNAGAFRMYLDAVLLNLKKDALEDFGPGRAGIFAQGCAASFESFAWTRGWDEWASGIRGWQSTDGAMLAGHADGIKLNGRQSAFKGDRLAGYEFSVQLWPGSAGGVYPVYIDESNCVKVSPDAAFNTLTISGKKEGKPIEEQSFDIRERIHRGHKAGSNGNHLRFVKEQEAIHVFAEGLELGAVFGPWPASQVGLFAGDGGTRFNGLTLYEI